jgi:predicted ATPase/DNA-binding winged helix-turn-helix (wHTH) protein
VPSDAFVFGSFRLMPTERTLLDGDKPLRVGSRALDILVTLLESAGETVCKDELMARAWPDTNVDEASLRVHIAALRKALGDGQAGNRFITNIPGRGYVFVAPATRERNDASMEPAVPTISGNDIPGSLTRIIGRDGVITTLVEQLAKRRLLTIVGPGGIGKTTIAAAVAGAARASYPDGVWFVGLASVPSPDLVPAALASVLGISLPAAEPIGGLVAWLRDKRALIILDNCEHVVVAAAALAEELVRSTPSIRLLATSREPLRAVGEWRHRLAPLEFPTRAEGLAAADAQQYPAVQLFSERAAATADEFAVRDSDVPALVEICRRLDGVPLALELAAAHVGVLGVKGLGERLDDRLALLIQGRRTSLPRHQTLRATLDWSYDLLPPTEQAILRRLAAFQGEFTMDAAGAVAADPTITPDAVVNGIANLVDKSLLAADIGGEVTYYHLLDMTRSYARERLLGSGEYGRIMRLHSEHFVAVFAASEAGTDVRPKEQWLRDYGRHIGNLRAALDWSFGPEGDGVIGVALAATATDFWCALALLRECCDWDMKAIASLGAAEGTRDEMRLQCSLGQCWTYSKGMRLDGKAALDRAATLAEALGELKYLARVYYALWLFDLRVSNFRGSIAHAHRCEVIGIDTGDATASAAADLMLGQSHYYLAEHARAARHLARARATYPLEMRGGDPVRYGVDLSTSIRCYRSVTLWSLGCVDQAYQMGREAVAGARAVNDPVSLCIALAAPSSIFLVKMGYLDDAGLCINELIDHSELHSLTPYTAFGICSNGGLMVARGELAEAERLLRIGLQRSREVGYSLFDAFFQGELAAVLGVTGRIEEAQSEIDAALRYAEQSESLWCQAELLRIKGELLARGDGADAEAWLLRSRDLARSQEALSWELRATMSLARLWRDRGRSKEAYAMLSAAYACFTEGFATADLRAAQDLLAHLPRS